MPQKFSNKARSQLLAAISSADTSFSVVATDADLFPTANVGTGTLPSAPGDWFKAVIEDGDGYEIVYVRTRSAGSNVFSNVLRGQEGTTARSFPAGAVVGLRVTAQDAETAAKVPDLQAQITGLANSKLDVAATSFGGNAATATKLQTPRTITIGNTGKSFDGSANVSWSLDEIGAARFGILPSGTNLNTVVAPGFYRLQANLVNAPGGVDYGQLIVARGGGDTILQILAGYTSDHIYWRSGNPPEVGNSNGQWYPWQEFYHTGNLDGYRLKNIRTISAVGSGTFTPTPGTKAMKVWVLGGGGSGAYSTDGIGGGGGGGGGCAFAFITQVVASYNYTVGAGGALAAPGACGNAGMASSFSTPSGSFSIIGGGGAGGRTTANWGYRFGGYGGYGSITSSSSEISASIIYPGQAGLGGAGSTGDGPAGAAGGGNHLFCNPSHAVHYQAGNTTPPGCGGNGNLGSNSYTPSKGGDGFILIWEFV